MSNPFKMDREDSRRDRAAMAMLGWAASQTRERTAEEAQGCNARRVRTRDFLQHASTGTVRVLGMTLSAEEAARATPEALDMMRRDCGACGLCARFGISPP